MLEDFLKWLKNQHTVTIVREGGQVRLGTMDATGHVAQMKWEHGSTLEDVIKKKLGD